MKGKMEERKRNETKGKMEERREQQREALGSNLQARLPSQASAFLSHEKAR